MAVGSVLTQLSPISFSMAVRTEPLQATAVGSHTTIQKKTEQSYFVSETKDQANRKL